MKYVTKSAFKPKAFEFFRMVEAGDSLVITDHGKPVAKIVPYADRENAIGALEDMLVTYVDPTEPVGMDQWESLR